MITIALLFLAGFFKAVMDVLQFHFAYSIFHNFKKDMYWNPYLSWKNKYNKEGRKKWFKLIPIPVLFTDAWHLFQSLFLTSLFIGICFYSPLFNNIIFDFILLRSVFGISFFVFYNYILKFSTYGS